MRRRAHISLRRLRPAARRAHACRRANATPRVQQGKKRRICGCTRPSLSLRQREDCRTRAPRPCTARRRGYCHHTDLFFLLRCPRAAGRGGTVLASPRPATRPSPRSPLPPRGPRPEGRRHRVSRFTIDRNPPARSAASNPRAPARCRGGCAHAARRLGLAWSPNESTAPMSAPASSSIAHAARSPAIAAKCSAVHLREGRGVSD